MGTLYYGVCKDCKRYIELDKFYSWSAYSDADHLTIDSTDLEEYKTDRWLYRALRLHIFLKAHNGHRVGVYTEHEFDVVDEKEFVEQFPWPAGLKHLTEKIEMAPSLDRLIIKTRLGDIYIDDTRNTVNCFRFVDGKRVDTVLLEKLHKEEE
jgi:hypothetical protein